MENNYRGISGIKFIWHGENADPELTYNDMTVNYYDVEEVVIDRYREERQSLGLSVVDDQDELCKYCRNHTDEIKNLIKEIWQTTSNN